MLLLLEAGLSVDIAMMTQLGMKAVLVAVAGEKENLPINFFSSFFPSFFPCFRFSCSYELKLCSQLVQGPLFPSA